VEAADRGAIAPIGPSAEAPSRFAIDDAARRVAAGARLRGRPKIARNLENRPSSVKDMNAPAISYLGDAGAHARDRESEDGAER
jgi:hypothetical protein